MARVARATGSVARAGIEGTTFTAVHAGVRNQEWFLSQPDATKQIILNSLAFGAFRFAQANKLPAWLGGGNAVVDGLIKQGLVIPGVITGVQLGAFDYDRIINKDPSLWNEVWSNFLLNAALSGFLALPSLRANGHQIVNGEIVSNGQKLKIRVAKGEYQVELPGKNSEKVWKKFEPTNKLKKEIDGSDRTSSQNNTENRDTPMEDGSAL